MFSKLNGLTCFLAPLLPTPRTGIEDLDSLARDWLTYWLLDMGRLGRVDFEQWIAGWPRPDFLRMPGLA